MLQSLNPVKTKYIVAVVLIHSNFIKPLPIPDAWNSTLVDDEYVMDICSIKAQKWQKALVMSDLWGVSLLSAVTWLG